MPIYNPIKGSCLSVERSIELLNTAESETMKKARRRQLVKAIGWVEGSCNNAAKFHPWALDF